MKPTILLSFLIVALNSFGQQCHRASWVKSFGGVNFGESFIDVEQHPEGGFVVMGQYSSAGITFGTASLPAGDGGYFLARVDSAGNFSQLIEILPLSYTTPKKMTVLNDGSVAVLANLNGNTTIGNETFDVHGGARALVVKFDNGFAYQWHISSSNMNNAVDSRDIDADAEGNIYCGGNFGGDYFVINDTWIYENNGAAWLCKISSQGSLEWINQLGTPNSSGVQTVSTDDVGNVWISGQANISVLSQFRFSDEIKYEGFLNSSYSLFVGKYSPDGACLWGNISTTSTANQSIYAWDATAGADGSMFFCGKATLTHYLGGKTIFGDDGSGFVFRMNATGDVDWVHTMGGQGSSEEASRLNYRDGKLAVVGYLFSNQPYIGTFPAHSLTASSARLFNVEFTEDGELIFTRVYEGGTQDHYVYDVVLDEDGQTIMFGYFKGTQTWYPISQTHSGSVPKLYLAKIREAAIVAFSISAGPDKNTTCGSNVQLSGSTTPSSGVDIGWFPSLGFSNNNSKTPNLQPTTPGSYVFTGYYQGCILTDTVNVTLDNFDLTLNVGDNISFCKGDTMEVTVSSNQPGATFVWTPNFRISSTTAATVDIYTNASLSYVVEATYDGCKAKDTLNVIVHQKPEINIPYNQNYISYQMHTCVGNVIDADLGLPENTYSIDPSDNIIWNSGHEVSFPTEVQYYGGNIYATSPEGCTNSLLFTVYGHNYQEAPPIIDSPTDTIYLCPGTGVQHEETVLISSDYVYDPLEFQYSWYPGWQVDSLDGLGWRDIEYYDYGHYYMFPYSYGDGNSAYYVQLELWNVHPEMDGYKFRAYISDICSERAYTEEMVLRVGPVLENQTSSLTICEGGSDSLFVQTDAIIGSYQWEVWHDGAWTIVVDGENNLSFQGNQLYITNAYPGMDSLFRCRTMGCEPNLFAYSDDIEVTVLPSDFEIAPLETMPVCAGENAVIQFETSGGSLTYQWYANGEIINDNEGVYSGTTNNILTIYNADESLSSALYKCRITSEQCGQDIFTEEINLQIIASPIVSWEFETDVLCADADIVELTGGAPFGGTYTGSGVSENLLDPSIAVPGNQQYTYTYLDSESGCSAIAIQNIVISELPNVEFTIQDSNVCTGDDMVVLSGGAPTGGYYSGPYVVVEDLGTYLFDSPSANAGEYEIIYSLSNEYGCTSESSDIITVYDETPIIWLDELGIFCSGSEELLITMPEPADGLFTGADVEDGILHPSNPEPGTYTVTYTFVNEFGCSSGYESAFTLIGVNTTWENFPSSICNDAEDILLEGGLPMGGVYSGQGVVNGIFQPTDLEEGSYTLSYIYVDDLSGCSDTTEVVAEIHEVPQIDWADDFGAYCIADSSVFIVNATPEGGIYSGGTIEDGYLDLTSLQAGPNTLYYNYTSAEGCSASDSSVIVLNADPVVTWVPAVDEGFDVCFNYDYYIDLSLYATPPGGIFSGADLNIENNIWHHELQLEENDVTIFYTFTDQETSCTTISSQIFHEEICLGIDKLEIIPVLSLVNGDQLIVKHNVPLHLEIFDSSGKMVWTKTMNDVSETWTLELASAIYFVKTQCNNGSWNYKIAVE